MKRRKGFGDMHASHRLKASSMLKGARVAAKSLSQALKRGDCHAAVGHMITANRYAARASAETFGSGRKKGLNVSHTVLNKLTVKFKKACVR